MLRCSFPRSVCIAWLPFSLKPWIISNCYDSVLVILRKVGGGDFGSSIFLTTLETRSASGYFSSRVYRSLGGSEAKKNAFITATVLPTTVFAIMFLLNFFLLFAGSSGAVPFGTMLLVVLLWFGISAPLSSVGSYFGNKHGVSSRVQLSPMKKILTYLQLRRSLIRCE